MCYGFAKKDASFNFGTFLSVMKMMIVCGVEHDDLKSLFFVSKAMREVVSCSCHGEFYRSFSIF